MRLDGENKSVPFILQDKKKVIHHPSHFVLIGGYDWENSSYRAYDPNQRYDGNKMYPPGLKKLYSDPTGRKKHTKLRIDRYKSDYARPTLSRILIQRLSPVELQLIDPDGNVTGYDPATGGEVADIPHAYYTEESESSVADNAPEVEPTKVFSINKPVAGNYILKIFGTGDGPYTIKMEGVRTDGTVNLALPLQAQQPQAFKRPTELHIPQLVRQLCPAQIKRQQPMQGATRLESRDMKSNWMGAGATIQTETR